MYNKPILFIIFNRLDYTKKVFEQIKKVKPKKLYICSDGARYIEEKSIVQEVREWVLGTIDWECEVKTRFLDKNLGCGFGIYKAIDWFFENEEEGLIIEDDVVPTESFFDFCAQMLDKYKDNKKIWHIGGSSFLEDLNLKEDYYFSKITHCWGWATWRDRWEKFDFDISFFKNKDFKKFSKRIAVQKHWEMIQKIVLEDKIEAWDYQWLFKIIQNKGLAITPTKNLITNIGTFGIHFEGYGHRLNRKSYEINQNLVHPKNFKIIKGLMDKIYKNVFLIDINRTYFNWFLRCLKIKFMEL